MRHYLIFGIVMVILASSASAANVHGTIYNLFLEAQNNVFVEINSVPAQTLISKDGQYSFDLPNGEYTINAQYSENGRIVSSASENISIVDEGNFVLDMVLFESIDEEFELLDTPGTIEVEEGTSIWIYAIIILVLVIIVGLLFYLKSRPLVKEIITEEKAAEKKEETSVGKEELDKLLWIIKSESGRITQKDLRKRLDLSEAKVSLMIAELESLGKVKKIKQGRGNIIVMT